MRNGIRGNIRATPTIVEGQRFASKSEARRWGELRLMERVGAITSLARQVVVNLAGVTYRPDFAYTERGASHQTFEDYHPRTFNSRDAVVFRLWSMYGPAPLRLTAFQGSRCVVVREVPAAPYIQPQAGGPVEPCLHVADPIGAGVVALLSPQGWRFCPSCRCAMPDQSVADGRSARQRKRRPEVAAPPETAAADTGSFFLGQHRAPPDYIVVSGVRYERQGNGSYSRAGRG